MSDAVIVGIISFIGTVIGTFGGILASNKLTNYRIEELEKKQDKHNKVIERVYKLEERDSIIEEEIKSVNLRIADLERS